LLKEESIMHTQSITRMAAVAASISSSYDRLLFCRTYARMHTSDETREFMRLTAALLPGGAGAHATSSGRKNQSSADRNAR
jgi:hypothetical protein